MSYVTTPQASKIPTPVIVSTDYSEDADDVFDLRALTTAHFRGLVTLLGVVVDNRTSGGGDNVSAVDAHLTYDGLPNLPLGVVSTTYAGTRPSSYVSAVTAAFPFTRTTGTAPSAATVLRTLLAARPGQDVTLLGLGFFGAWADLLASAADGISPLTGVQLVQQKVKRAIMFGGKYPTDTSFVEYNFGQGPTSATSYFLANWPSTVPVTWLGYETGINSVGGAVLDSRAGGSELVQTALTASGNPSGKIAWPASVLIAAKGDAASAGFQTVRGTVTADASFHSIFTEGASNHEYATLPLTSAKLTATASAGNTTLSIDRKISAGTYRLGTTATGESITINDVTGTTSPYTATLASAVTGATYASNSPIVGADPVAVAQIKADFEDLLIRRAPLVVDEALWTPANSMRPPDVWLKAEDLSGLGVAGAVASWTDASGNAHHFTQATANQRPVMAQDAKSRWLVRFDGVNDRLDNADAGILNPSNFTLWIVAAWNGSGSQCIAGAHFSATLHTSPFFRWTLIRNNTDFGSFSRVAATKSNPDPVAQVGGSNALSGWDAVNVYEVCPGSDGTAAGDPWVIRRNGAPVGWSPPGGSAGNTAAVFRLGGLGDGTWPFNGDIYEVLFYTVAQSPAERRRVRAYLRKKYQTT